MAAASSGDTLAEAAVPETENTAVGPHDGKVVYEYFTHEIGISDAVVKIGCKCLRLKVHRDGALVFWELRRFACIVHSEQKQNRRRARLVALLHPIHLPETHISASAKAAAKKSTSGVVTEELSASTCALLFLLLHSSQMGQHRQPSDLIHAERLLTAVVHKFTQARTVLLDIVLDTQHVARAHVAPTGESLDSAPCSSTITIESGTVRTSVCVQKAAQLEPRSSRVISRAFQGSDGMPLVRWLGILFSSNTWWLLHQVLVELASFMEHLGPDAGFTQDPLAADLPILKTKQGNTRRVDPLLRAASLEFTNPRGALHVMGEVKKRLGGRVLSSTCTRVNET